jgi:hypothetical protein
MANTDLHVRPNLDRHHSRTRDIAVLCALTRGRARRDHRRRAAGVVGAVGCAVAPRGGQGMSDWDSGQVMPNNEAAFDAAIEQLRVQAFALSTQFTSDAAVRKSYVKNFLAMTSDLRMKVR